MKQKFDKTSPMSANIDEVGAHDCPLQDTNRFTKQDAYEVWSLLTDLASQLFAGQGDEMGIGEQERIECLRASSLIKKTLHKIIHHEGA
jgi:hypothetical protein